MTITAEQLRYLDEQAFTALLDIVIAEHDRRTVLRTAQQQATQLAHDWAEAAGRHDGDAWVQPVGAFDAYPEGAVVTHEGQHYRNDHDGLNAWRPGDVGVPWTPVWPTDDGDWSTAPPTQDDGGPAAWMPGIAYEKGDRVTHDGSVWVCILQHTSHEGWKPSLATHAVWKPVTP